MSHAAAPRSPAAPALVLDLSPRVRSRYGRWVDELAPYVERGDPLADALAERCRERGGLVAATSAALRAGRAPVDAPVELRDYIESLRARPRWLDPEACARGGRAYLASGPLAAIVLSFYSLPASYASPDGNKPLVLTGALTRRARARLAQTGRYVLEVCRNDDLRLGLPAGLAPGAPGFVLSGEVRLRHALIRRGLLRDSGGERQRSLDPRARWQPTWGVPINQLYMAGTGVLFGGAVIDGLRRLGVPLDEDEREDVFHLWRYAAHLMGVDPAINPASLEEALRLDAFLGDSRREADADSRRLIAALLDAYGAQTAELQLLRARTAFPRAAAFVAGGRTLAAHVGVGPVDIEAPLARAVRGAAEAMTRHLVGDPLADELGLARRPGDDRRVRSVRLLAASFDRARRHDLEHAYRQGVLGWERAADDARPARTG